MSLDQPAQAKDAQLIATNLENAYKNHDQNALHRAQLEFLTIYKDDPQAFASMQTQVLADLVKDVGNNSEVINMLSNFKLLGIEQPTNNITSTPDGKGGFDVSFPKGDPLHVGADNSYSFTDNNGTLKEFPGFFNGDSQMQANAQKNAATIAKDIESGDPQSIHRAQMEMLELYKLCGGDKTQINTIATYIHQDLVRDNKPGWQDNQTKFGLINLGNGYSPDSVSPGSYNVTYSDNGYKVQWTGTDGKVHPLFDDKMLTTNNDDYFKIDSQTGLISTKYDASTVETWLKTGGDAWSWYHAGEQLYSSYKHMNKDEFNAICQQLADDAAKPGSNLPKITLVKDSNGNVTEVNVPGGQIFQQMIADGWLGQNLAHPLESSEAKAAVFD